MRNIDYIVVHFSATPEGRDVDASQIREWHLDRGWDDIGYHYVVKLDGTIQKGRNDDEIGAHCYGHNQNSIGVCFIGGLSKDSSKSLDTRTDRQIDSMTHLLTVLKRMHPDAEIVGHNDLRPTECPGFDAKAEYANLK
jgi:N-acetylmuramoyl-L-alanine amidase